MKRVARYLKFSLTEGRSAAIAGLATKFIANGRETTLYMGDEWLGWWVKGMLCSCGSVMRWIGSPVGTGGRVFCIV